MREHAEGFLRGGGIHIGYRKTNPNGLYPTHGQKNILQPPIVNGRRGIKEEHATNYVNGSNLEPSDRQGVGMSTFSFRFRPKVRCSCCFLSTSTLLSKPVPHLLQKLVVVGVTAVLGTLHQIRRIHLESTAAAVGGTAAAVGGTAIDIDIDVAVAARLGYGTPRQQHHGHDGPDTEQYGSGFGLHWWCDTWERELALTRPSRGEGGGG